jgi:acetyl-CoA C-acetyltransferase
LGEAALKKPSVAGGLSFFGAPLNSYMTHAATAMVRALRAGEGARGLLYGQGEYVTKHHALAVGREPSLGDLAGGDMNAEADAARGEVPKLARDAAGAAVIEAYTVMFDRHGEPTFAAIVARGDDGWRTLARSEDKDVVAQCLDRATTPVGRPGKVALDVQNRPEWSFV